MIERRADIGFAWRHPRVLAVDDAGNAVIEGVIFAALFIVFIAAALIGVRLCMASMVVTQAAADAARQASIARTIAQARTAATTSALSTLNDRGLHCTPHISMDLSGFGQPVGRPGTVTARVRCTVQLAELAIPGMPGARTVTATHRSVLDPYRSR